VEQSISQARRARTPNEQRYSARLLLRPEEGADAIGVSRAKFSSLLAAGEIPSLKIGRSRRVPLDELEAWVRRELGRQSA
jgi:excisionase family DNA binding protein